MIPALHYGIIKPGVSVQRNVSPVIGKQLQDDILRFVNEGADCRDFFFIYEELRRLDIIQRDRQTFRLWECQQDAFMRIVKRCDMRRIEAKFLNGLLVCVWVLTSDDCFKIGNDLNLAGFTVYEKASMLLKNVFCEPDVVIGVYPLNFHFRSIPAQSV